MLHQSVWKYYVFLLQATPTAKPSFSQFAGTVNQLSFGSWPIFPLDLVQVCESIWKLGTFLQQATPIAMPPFSHLA